MNRVFLLCLGLQLAALGAGAQDYHVYFGTYTDGQSRGIYVSQFDSKTGKLTPPELAVEARNPSFLALHPGGKFLYSSAEINSLDGQRGGAVEAFSVDDATGKLRSLNHQKSGGSAPCHLSVDATGRCLLAANYGSGTVAAFPIHPDGSLGAASTTLQHTGSSVNTARQSGPHAHFICPSPDNRFALACDLGLDQVLVYHLNAGSAVLTPNTPPFATVPPGSGARHLAFSTDHKWAFVINEMTLTVSSFRYDAASGTLTAVQTLSTLPKDHPATPADSCAEIRVHPNGKFVYGSNRGHDSLTVFALDRRHGNLKFIENQPTGGKTPRHFELSPDGRWLIAENQNSDSITVFSINTSTGRLTPTGQSVALGAPVCSVFLPKK